MVYQRAFLIAAALIQRGDEILLVRQQGPDDAAAFWALPGGVVEKHELLTEALVREVLEETGLKISKIARLLYVTQFDNPLSQSLRGGDEVVQPYQSVAFVFQASEWEGELHGDDPDRFVREVGFFSIRDAISKLGQLPFRVMREPIIAYLHGEIDAGAMWIYRRDVNMGDQLVVRL